MAAVNWNQVAGKSLAVITYAVFSVCFGLVNVAMDIAGERMAEKRSQPEAVVCLHVDTGCLPVGAIPGLPVGEAERPPVNRYRYRFVAEADRPRKKAKKSYLRYLEECFKKRFSKKGIA